MLARKVVMVASGEDKADAIRATVQGDGAGAGGQAQHAVWLAQHLGGDKTGGGPAHFLVILDRDDPRDEKLPFLDVTGDQLITPAGLHIHPEVIRMVHRLYGERLNLISDSLRCAGMPDGDYELGGQPITVILMMKNSPFLMSQVVN